MKLGWTAGGGRKGGEGSARAARGRSFIEAAGAMAAGGGATACTPTLLAHARRAQAKALPTGGRGAPPPPQRRGSYLGLPVGSPASYLSTSLAKWMPMMCQLK